MCPETRDSRSTMKAPGATIAQLIEILQTLPPDLPVFIDVGFGPTPAKGIAFEARLVSDDALDGAPTPQEGAVGLSAAIIS